MSIRRQWIFMTLQFKTMKKKHTKNVQRFLFWLRQLSFWVQCKNETSDDEKPLKTQSWTENKNKSKTKIESWINSIDREWSLAWIYTNTIKISKYSRLKLYQNVSPFVVVFDYIFAFHVFENWTNRPFLAHSLDATIALVTCITNFDSTFAWSVAKISYLQKYKQNVPKSKRHWRR